MVIVKLEIAHFGKLKDKTISLRPGMNVITGENESGKSTIAAFVKSMIYGMGDYRDIRKYEPYENDGVFGGKMRILVSGAFYVIERSFIKGNESLLIVKEADDSAIPDPEAFLKEAVNGLTEEEFSETAYAAQNFCLQDMQRLRETPEKRSALENEKSIRKEIRQAREKLRQEYDEKKEKLKNLDDSRAEAIRNEIGEKTDEAARLSEEYPEIMKTLQKMQDSYQKEVRRVNEDRQKAREALRTEMLERKQELEAHTKEADQKIRKNVPGIALMTVSFLIAIGTYFYMSSNRIDSTSGVMFYAMLGAFTCAFLLFVTGVVLTAVRSSRNRKIMKEMDAAVLCRKRAEEAEQRYEEFVRENDKKSPDSQNDDLREEKIRELTKQADEMQAEMEKNSRQLSELSEMNRQLESDIGEKDRLRRELAAMELSLEAFEDISAAERKDDAFSEAATEFLKRLDPRKGDVIRADGGFITVNSGAAELTLDQLSLSAAVEVLLASRIAGLDEKDAKKVVPMILDDVLAGLDSERVNSSMGLLRSLGRQVILFSCQQRERKAL